MKKALFILFAFVFVACSSTFQLATPQQSDVDRVSTKYPGYNLSALNDGKALYQENCNKCHKLKNPTSRNETKWNKIVPKMVGKLNKKEGKTAVDQNQQELILRYIVTMGSAPK